MSNVVVFVSALVIPVLLVWLAWTPGKELRMTFGCAKRVKKWRSRVTYWFVVCAALIPLGFFIEDGDLRMRVVLGSWLIFVLASLVGFVWGKLYRSSQRHGSEPSVLHY